MKDTVWFEKQHEASLNISHEVWTAVGEATDDPGLSHTFLPLPLPCHKAAEEKRLSIV